MCSHFDRRSDVTGHDVVKRAVHLMVNVAVSINELKRKQDKLVRVMELQARLVPRCFAQDISALGQLVLEVDVPTIWPPCLTISR